MFFGDFLVFIGRIDEASLQRALDAQNRRNKKIGELAIEHGWMSEEAVARVRQLQRHDERLFGELAGALGLLTSAQVATLEQEQKEGHLKIGQALVEEGVLRAEDLADALRSWAAYVEEEERLVGRTISDSPHPRVVVALLSATRLWLTRLGLVGCRATAVRIAPHASAGIGWSAFLDLSGKVSVGVGLGLSGDGLVALARGHGQELVEGRLREGLPALGEALRSIAERAASELDGLSLEVGPPQVAEGDGFVFLAPLIAELDLAQVELALAVPGGPSARGVLTVATRR